MLVAIPETSHYLHPIAGVAFVFPDEDSDFGDNTLFIGYLQARVIF